MAQRLVETPFKADLSVITTSVAKTVGSNLKSRREALGYTQVDVARALKVDRSLVSQYESATIDIPLSRLVALSLLYTMPITHWFECIECLAEPNPLTQTNDMRETVQQMRDLLKTFDMQQFMGMTPKGVKVDVEMPAPDSKTTK